MSKKCVTCAKTVYLTEQVGGCDVPIHTTCFYCQFPGCSVKLQIQTYAAVDKKLYCQSHFKELTAKKKYVGQDAPVKEIPKSSSPKTTSNLPPPPVKTTVGSPVKSKNENGLLIDNTGKPISKFGQNANDLTKKFSDVRSGLKKTTPTGFSTDDKWK
jgi:hypothetical protein